ncbi:uncharacterized protein LOC135680894 isoform X1 [Rhopilema esculentum]|uniref:uncharacterized protein LOC135680894 isoform X1 n=1 Tax=Rhopilema esculentum TaxID=499914 RepID=UPI0031D8C93E
MVSQFFPRSVLSNGLNIMHGLASTIVEMSTLFKRELTETYSMRNHEKKTQLDTEESINLGIEDVNEKNFQRADITQLNIFGTVFLTLVSTFSVDWLQHLVKVECYYMLSLCETIAMLLIIQAFPIMKGKGRNDSVFSLHENKSRVLIVIIQSLVMAFIGGYWKESASNNHCPDFYELFIVLSVPSAILWTYCQSSSSSLARSHEGIIIAVSGVKLLILCTSPTYTLQISRSLSCLLLSAAYGFYLSLINSLLKKNHAIAVLRWLLLWKIPLACLLMIISGELQTAHKISLFRDLPLVFALALATTLKMMFVFVLMKHSSTLTCVVAMNMAWVPMTLVRAFVFKYLFLVTSFKLLWLFFTDFVILFLHAKLKLFTESFFSVLQIISAKFFVNTFT